jgi:hypothetical protein
MQESCIVESMALAFGATRSPCAVAQNRAVPHSARNRAISSERRVANCHFSQEKRHFALRFLRTTIIFSMTYDGSPSVYRISSSYIRL